MTLGGRVSTFEAVEVLRVSHRELYRMIDQGEVPARRCGGRLKVYPWDHRRSVMRVVR